MKNIFGVVLMTIVTVLGIIGYVPQIIQMYKTKSSIDISISSWLQYFIASLFYVIYIIIYSFDFLIFIEAIIEVILNLTTLVMCIFYKKNRKG